jgi:trk system potassium uptake protein TrkA
MAKRIFILGGGRFGVHLATRLSELGCEVVIGDSGAARVKDLADDGFHVLEMDASDEDALQSAGVLEADVVVVAIGDNMQGSILASLLLKQLGAKRVVARALDVKHAQVLERLGVDEVVLPSREVAQRLAECLHEGVPGGRQPIAGDYVLAEVRLGAALDGQTLAQAQLPRNHGITAVLLKRPAGGGIEVDEARGDLRLAAGCELVVVGKRERIARFERACGDGPVAKTG